MSTSGAFSLRIPHRSDDQLEQACLSSDSLLSSVPTIPDSPDPLADFTLLPNRDSSPDSELLREDENDSQYADDDAFSDSLSGHDNKRRKVPYSSTVVPLAVREKLFRLYDEKCWLCGVYAKHIAHVIAKSEGHLFREYTRQGVLHMPSLNAIENLVPLCPTCHNTFNKRCPVCAFLPPLGPFIAREEEFQARRLLLASSTPSVSYARPNPYVTGTPKLVYRRYQIRPGHLLPNAFATREKLWMGNPIATILRGVNILAGVTRLHAERESGLPEKVASQLAHLLLLYGTPAPEVGIPRIIEVHHHDGAVDKQDYRDNTHKQGDSTQLLTPETSRKRPCTSAGAHLQAGAIKRTKHHQESSMEMIDRGHREGWVFGPEMTSVCMMDWWGYWGGNLGDQ